MSTMSNNMIPMPVLKCEVAQEVVRGKIFRLRHDLVWYAQVVAKVQGERTSLLTRVREEYGSSIIVVVGVAVVANQAIRW